MIVGVPFITISNGAILLGRNINPGFIFIFLKNLQWKEEIKMKWRETNVLKG